MDLFDCALAARPVALTPVDSPQTLECSRTPRGHYGNASSAGSATNSGRSGRSRNVLTALKALSAMIAMIAMIAAFCVLAVPPAIPAAHGAESSADERARHERVAAALVEIVERSRQHGQLVGRRIETFYRRFWICGQVF